MAMAARMPITTITTRISIRVKPRFFFMWQGLPRKAFSWGPGAVSTRADERPPGADERFSRLGEGAFGRAVRYNRGLVLL
jgi:hypothetical protein